MKTLFACVVLLSVCFSTLSAVPIDPAAYTAPIRVACVGDSITAGAGAEKGKAYPSQVQALLGDKWVVKNFGVSGRTLLAKGDHPYIKEKAYADAQAFLPDVVVIMLGTNDTKPQNWVHEDEFVADYKALIESFKGLSSHPRVFICRPCPVPGKGNFGINEANLQIEIPVIDKIATEEGADLIDMHAVLQSHPELLPDRVHPNTTGAGIMAQTVATALTGKPAPAAP